MIWAEVSSALVPAKGDAPAFFATVVVSVTERKRAEEDLRHSEAYLAQGQRISQTGSWGWHVATGSLSSRRRNIIGFLTMILKPPRSRIRCSWKGFIPRTFSH